MIHVIPITNTAYHLLDCLGVGLEGVLGRLEALPLGVEQSPPQLVEIAELISMSVWERGALNQEERRHQLEMLRIMGGYRLFGIPEENPHAIHFMMRVCNCLSGAALRVIREGIPIMDNGFVVLESLPLDLQQQHTEMVEEITMQGQRSSQVPTWVDIHNLDLQPIDDDMMERLVIDLNETIRLCNSLPAIPILLDVPYGSDSYRSLFVQSSFYKGAALFYLRDSSERLAKARKAAKRVWQKDVAVGGFNIFLAIVLLLLFIKSYS